MTRIDSNGRWVDDDDRCRGLSEREKEQNCQGRDWLREARSLFVTVDHSLWNEVVLRMKVVGLGEREEEGNGRKLMWDDTTAQPNDSLRFGSKGKSRVVVISWQLRC